MKAFVCVYLHNEPSKKAKTLTQAAAVTDLTPTFVNSWLITRSPMHFGIGAMTRGSTLPLEF